MESRSSVGPDLVWMIATAALLLWCGAYGPDLYDSGELVAAAWELGGSHPPGQPLHAILGHLCSLVPLGPIPYRVMWLSIAGELIAAWWTGRSASFLARQVSVTYAPGVPQLAANIAGICALLAPPMLRQVARVEVYGVAIALTSVATFYLLMWAASPEESHSQIRCAAWCTGLTAAIHPPHALAIVMIAIGIVLCIGSRVAGSIRSLTVWILCFALGAVLYAYLPIRAKAGAFMWGTPETVRGFFDYVSARSYQHNLGALTRPWFELPLDALRYAFLSAGCVGVVGMPLFFVRAWKAHSDRKWVRIALVSLATCLAAGCLQPLVISNPDNVAYLAPMTGLLIALSAAGVARLATVWNLSLRFQPVLMLLCLAPWQMRNIPSILFSNHDALDSFASSLLDTPSPRALVLTDTDFVSAAWMMNRAIEGARPDVAFFVTGLSTSSWQWRSLSNHPGFDGKPIASDSKDMDIHERYTRGLLGSLVGRVSVFAESTSWFYGRGRINGAYLELPTNSEAALATKRFPFGERFVAHIDAEAAQGLLGDFDGDGAVYRNYMVHRAQRLVARGRTRQASLTFYAALSWMPKRERDRIKLVDDERPVRGARVVRDPHAFLCSREDLVREAAVFLWAVQKDDVAHKVLQEQRMRGDARAMLQMAWLYQGEGKVIEAKRWLTLFIQGAPNLKDEAEELRSELVFPN